MNWEHQIFIVTNRFESSSSVEDKGEQSRMISTLDALDLFESLGFRISRTKLWHLGDTGKVACSKVSERKWFWNENDIINYVTGLKESLL